MIGIFKQKNPGNALLLLLYGLVLKFPLFLNPANPLPDKGNNYLYDLILSYLNPIAGNAPVVYSILAFILLFTQATLLNRITNSLKLFPKSNYLVGMSFLLGTSLMAEWTSFSAPLLVNSLMVWVWYRMIRLYNNNNPKTSIYNVGVMVGLAPLIYSPAIVFVLLLLFALIITRPGRITEWLVALFGILTPYYFLFIILFLTDQWELKNIIPFITFHIPRIPVTFWAIGGIVLLALPFLSGGYYVQDNLNKMLIQVRKAWSLLLLFLIVSLLVVMINSGGHYLHWMLIAIPIVVFHAATYFYTTSRWLPVLLHWVTFIFAILLNYKV